MELEISNVRLILEQLFILVLCNPQFKPTSGYDYEDYTHNNIQTMRNKFLIRSDRDIMIHTFCCLDEDICC
jgi:hypothetical protein